MSRKSDEGNDPYDVGEAEPLRETDKAILFDIEGAERWIPKSVIHDNSEVWEMGQKAGTLTVKRWFAEKSGWC